MGFEIRFDFEDFEDFTRMIGFYLSLDEEIAAEPNPVPAKTLPAKKEMRGSKTLQFHSMIKEYVASNPQTPYREARKTVSHNLKLRKTLV